MDGYFLNPFKHEWSMKMWDSNGHFPSGILMGSFFEPGNFDECLTIESKDEYDVRGKYCIMEIKLPEINDTKNVPILSSNNSFIVKNLYESLRFVYNWETFSGINNGLCLPSTCDEYELNEIWRKIIHVNPNSMDLRIRIRMCQERKTQTLNKPIRFGEKIIRAIFFSHLLLMFIGTLLDLCSYQPTSSSNGLMEILSSFSLIKNTNTLFKLSDNDNQTNSSQLKFIHGLRVLSIYWIIFAHVFLFYPFTHFDDLVSPVQSIDKRVNIIHNLFAHFIINAGLAVETFFFISGTLTIYTVLMINKTSINFLNYVWLRWIRFTPSLIGATCLLLLWPRVGDGPLFHSDYIDFITEPCYQNWFLGFSYISNFFPSEKVCNVMHWYLSADFQLHILLYVCLYLIIKNYHLSISIAYSIFMIVIGFLIPIIIVVMNYGSAPNPSIFLHPNYRFPIEKVELFIFATWNHFIPYFFGSLFGILLIRRNRQQSNHLTISSMAKWKRYVIWLIIGPLFLLQPFGSYSFANSDKPIDEPLISAILFSIIRTIWSIGIFWLCLQCAQRKCGIIQRFLEAKFIQPFSRLSFCIYLVHIIPIWHFMFTIRQPIDISLFNLLFIGFGSSFISTILAYFLYCSFERPYVCLFKILMNNNNNDNNNQSNDQNNINNHKNTIIIDNINNNGDGNKIKL